MALHSESLFHYMRYYRFLEQKLKRGYFTPRYYVEEDWPELFAVPMVCFCVIPLALSKNHMERYGSYGIGLSKEWLDKQLKLNIPLKSLHYVEKPKDKEFVQALRLRNGDVYDKLQFCKPYYRAKGKVPYADEHEWRFVPTQVEVPIIAHDIPLNDKERKKYLDALNSQVKDIRLEFSFSDIEYIIIRSESMRDKVISLIRKVGEKNGEDAKSIYRTISKIILAKNIKNDF